MLLMFVASLLTGELPLEVIRLIATMRSAGKIVSLDRNVGFTLPHNLGDLDTAIVSLDLSGCELRGAALLCCTAAVIHMSLISSYLVPT